MLGARASLVLRLGAMRAAARTLVFPLVMGGALALMLGLLAAGVAPPWALVVTNLTSIPLVIAAEHVFPFRDDWNRNHGDVGPDAAHAVVSGIAGLNLAR